METASITPLPLFVYGTLRPGASNYPHYIAGRTEAEQPAVLRSAALYTDGVYPYLILEPDLIEPDDVVVGTLIRFRPECYVETLARIDRLEDYAPGNPWSMYERVAQAVERGDRLIEAWTYVAGPRTLAAIRAGKLRKLPSGEWTAALNR